MNNEIIENNIQDNNENQKNQIYQINIVKSNIEEIIPQTPMKNQKNRLFLSPPIKRKKTRKEDEINRALLENSFREKKRNINPLDKDDKPLNSPKSENSPKNILKIINNDDKINNANSVNSANYNNNKKEVLYQNRNISKRKIFQDYYNNYYNNNNTIRKNENKFLKILDFANKLYENDEHLKKQKLTKKLTKKIDSNGGENIEKNGLSITLRLDNKNIEKKPFIKLFGLNENENQNSINGSYSKNLILYKGSLSSAIKSIPLKELNISKEKSSFSNFSKLKSPKIEIGDESSKNIDNKLILGNSSIRHYKPNKDDDITAKSSKFYLNSKTLKTKNINFGKFLEKKTDKNKIKSKFSIKTNKTKSQKKEDLNNNKNQANDLVITKKEISKNKENKIENNINKKIKKFCFFCCLNANENDFDDI